MHIDEIERRFTYHAPSGNQPKKYEHLRRMVLALATIFNDNIPESREKEIAIGKLEEAIMWANAGIARREGPVEAKYGSEVGLAAAPEPDCKPGSAVGMGMRSGKTLIFPEVGRKRTPFLVSSHLEAYERGLKAGRDEETQLAADAHKEGFEAGRRRGQAEACDKIKKSSMRDLV